MTRKHDPPTPERIRAAREAAGLTQVEAAALVHAALNTWSQWERGQRQMHAAFWELFRIKAARIKAAGTNQQPPGS